MSGYKVTIIVEAGYEEQITKFAKNKDEVIRILQHHIACSVGDIARVDKK